MRNLSDRLNTVGKRILFLGGAFVVTMGAAVIASTAIMLLMAPESCGAMGQAVLLLLATIGALFSASVVLIGAVVWKTKGGVGGRVTGVAIYAGVLLTSYIFVALALLVALNC